MLETYAFEPYHKTLASPPIYDVTGADDVTLFPHTRQVGQVSGFLKQNTLRVMLDIAQENIQGADSLSVLEVGGCSVAKR